MAKISKNAKKLLALTLAGVMTVGTAVPGTVVSTTQDVQAATTAADANEALATVENVYKSHGELAAGVMVAGDKYTVDEDMVIKTLTSDTALEEIVKNWTIEITDTQSNYSHIETGIKFTVTAKDDSDATATSKDFISTGVNFYTAQDVAAEIGEITDLQDAVSSLAVDAKDADVKTAIQDYITNNVLANVSVGSKYKVAASVSKVNTPIEGYATTYKVTGITITNNNSGQAADKASLTLTSEDIADGIYVSWGTPGESIVNQLAMDSVKKYLADGLTITSDDAIYGVSLAPDTDAIDQISSWIVAKINAHLAQDANFNAYNSRADIATMLDDNVWRANVTVGNLTETISVKLTKESALEQPIVRITIDDSKDVLTSNDTITTAIPELTMWFADGSKSTSAANATGTITNPATDKEVSNVYYYDQTAFDVTKLGQISFEIKAFDSYASGNNAKTTYTAKVVHDEEYNDHVNSLGGVASSNVESITSSDENVLQIVYDDVEDTYTLRGVAKGSAYVTVTDNKGQSQTTKVTVSENSATAFVYGTTQITTSMSYVQNSPSIIGFTATNIKSKMQDVTNWKDGNTVATASIEDGKIKFEAVAEGSAEFKVTGGDNGKLETTITVKVDSKHNITSIKFPNDEDQNTWFGVNAKLALNRDALTTISNLTFSDDDLGILDPETVFTGANDKLLITSNAHKEGIDSVDATEMTKVLLKKNGSGYQLVLTYGTLDDLTVNVKSEQTALAIGIDQLSITPDSFEIDLTNSASATSDVFNGEIKTDKNGVVKLYVTPGTQIKDGDTATITIKDVLGNTATAYITYTTAKGITANYKESSAYAKHTLIGTSSHKDNEGNIKPDGSKESDIIKTYTLGESVNFDDLYLQSPEGNKVQITADMVATNYNTDTAFVSGTTLATQYAKVSYGGFAGNTTNNKGAIPFTVKPAYEKFSTSDLELADDDAVSSVSYVGDSTISAKLSSDKKSIEIIATKIEQSGAAVITTKNGNSLAVKITVEEDGTISTTLTKDFAESVTTVDNTVETLGIVGTSVTSSNTNVVAAELVAGKVVLTSVNPGTATISVVGDGKTALITVTVDVFGTITIDNIEKVVYEGFVRGEAITEGEYAGLDNWYYYIDGEMVTNNWVEVNENGTNVWYHFDKDGKMSRGWIIDESGWKIYNLDSNGRMRKDMWINAAANDALGMPAGLYHLQSDGAVQMNGWAESVTAGIYWYCNAGTGLFEQGNPASWSNSKLW